MKYVYDTNIFIYYLADDDIVTSFFSQAFFEFASDFYLTNCQN